MQNRSRAALIALTAAFVLGSAVGGASARRLELSNQSFTAKWAELRFTALGGLITVACAVTLEGSFHSRTLSKVSGQLIGVVTKAALTRPCNGGEAWILNGIERPANTLPWHIRYDSFIGALPRITGIRIQLIGAAFLLTTTVPRAECLYVSTTENPAFGIINRNTTTEEVATIEAEEGSAIRLSAALNGSSCPATGSFAGSANVTLLGTTTRIRVRLVQ